MLYFPLMKIAVVGLGFMGSMHLKALKNVAEAELESEEVVIAAATDGSTDGALVIYQDY